MNEILRHDQKTGDRVLRPDLEVNITFKTCMQNPISTLLVM